MTCAVILAAGQSVRLRPLTDDLPKCLLPMGPKTILDWQLDALRTVDVEEVFLVVGYRKEMIEQHIREQHPTLRVTYVENADYSTTNTLFSLRKALEAYNGDDYFYLNADVVFDEGIIARLAALSQGGFLAIDRKQCREEEVKVMVNENIITEIGKHLNPDACYGEFIGVAKYTGAFAARFKQTVFEQAVAGNEMKFFEWALDVMPDKHDMVAVDITGLPCVEVDFPEDYAYAVNEVLQTFNKGVGK